jgi:hypothetical protein
MSEVTLIGDKDHALPVVCSKRRPLGAVRSGGGLPGVHFTRPMPISGHGDMLVVGIGGTYPPGLWRKW